ncbi:DUF885 domain-containing protein [Corallincola spongiicola]|uniref:DUF885 domain-containing protein n=1 Tax=Corallincola spongiicola TaxID=2520508 RepID=A0ABY1WPD1_9GAMM|nr:DUF885 domain-containing protein [Corallincola spongiicola]TAA45938.1 DUF885 domain-containing protein [Corallincola spongiicola]
MRFLIILCALWFAGCSDTGDAPAPEQQELQQLLAQVWQYRLEQDPLLASYSGSALGADRLPDLSPQALAAHRTKLTDYYEQFNLLAESAELQSEDRINLRLMQYAIKNEIDELRFNAQMMPLTSEYGFHAGIAHLPSMTTMDSVQAVEDYLARLAEIPRYFQQNIDWMRKGIATGRTVPKAVLTGYETTISAFIVDDPVDSDFYQPLKTLDLDLPVEQLTTLKLRARQLVKTAVMPAYRDYLTFFMQEYQPATRDTLAVSALENGDQYYANRIGYYTTTNMGAGEIHQLGLQEMARIRSEMGEVMRDADFSGSLAEFIEFLRTDPQFYAKTPEQLLHYAAWLAKKADAALPAFFNTLPRRTYGVEPVPANIAPKYTTGRYVGPSGDDRPGYYWVNTHALDKRPLYVLEALTLHEAVPGHHLQNALALEMEQVPEFRRHLYLSAFGEGWGLYSEWLGQEMGFYQDPYTRFGRLSYEAWRACRLVVDTGIHAMGWSRDQAIEYMEVNTALSKHNIRTEVDRYISWPAQALSYKIGELTIKRLRKEAELTLGERFDIRTFHDALLANGAVTLQQLEQQVAAYISQQGAQ